MKRLLFLFALACVGYAGAQVRIPAPPNALANDYKVNALVATTGNVVIADDLDPGDTVDGVTLAAGNRILVKSQTTASQNGIYVCSTSSERATDSDAWVEFNGSQVVVTGGTVNAGTEWVCSTPVYGTVGTTDVSYLRSVSVDSEGVSRLNVFTTGVSEVSTGYLGMYSGEHAFASYFAPYNSLGQDTYYNAPNSTTASATLVTEESIGTFAGLRAQRLVSLPFAPHVGNSTANVSGASGAVGTGSGSYWPFVLSATSAASVNRSGWSTESVGHLFGGSAALGGTAASDFTRKWRFEFGASVKLAADAASRVSLHLLVAAAPSTLNRPATEGMSILWRGGASQGTVELYTYSGSAGSSSATYNVAKEDGAMHLYGLEWEPGVALRLYVDGVLACTQLAATTHLPTGAGPSNGQGVYWLCENTDLSRATPTGATFYGGNVVFLP